jgi:hypothetical protein
MALFGADVNEWASMPSPIRSRACC